MFAIVWCCLQVLQKNQKRWVSLIIEILAEFWSWSWPNYIWQDQSLTTLHCMPCLLQGDLPRVSQVLCSKMAFAFSHSLRAVPRSADLSTLVLDLWIVIIPYHLLLFCSVIHSSARVWNKTIVIWWSFSEVPPCTVDNYCDTVGCLATLSSFAFKAPIRW